MPVGIGALQAVRPNLSDAAAQGLCGRAGRFDLAGGVPALVRDEKAADAQERKGVLDEDAQRGDSLGEGDVEAGAEPRRAPGRFGAVDEPLDVLEAESLRRVEGPSDFPRGGVEKEEATVRPEGGDDEARDAGAAPDVDDLRASRNVIDGKGAIDHDLCS